MKRSRIYEISIVTVLVLATIAIAVTTVVLVLRQEDELMRKDHSENLQLVQLIFRHGARTPTSQLPNDQYFNYTWPEGMGGLTTHGKEHMFKYGQLIRDRYHFYIENILSRNVIAQSSPVRRCLETTLAVLAGMMKPLKSQIWSSIFGLANEWQPIGVSTVEKDSAYLLGDSPLCPKVDQLDDMSELPETKQFLANNENFLQRLSNQTGLNVSGSKWRLVAAMYDSMVCEKDYFGDEYKQPEWVNKVGPDCMERLKAFNDFVFTVNKYYKAPYHRLTAGPFIKEMLLKMEETVNNAININNRKLYTYGTHDLVVSRVLAAFGFLKEQPRFGSGLIIELRSDEQNPNQSNVHLLYVNGTNNFDIYPLYLNESKTFSSYCSEIHCSLDNFTTSLQSFIPDDIKVECGVTTEKQ
ncbi:hypothetical protein RDWZM_004312 [Blomia tropicalis]|uniref:acid phosphatase n=1 Tax=Blomia tropicalis TaxID=40697 RepID=A0A9Q0MJS4_BLOTA|nr:hypothetical protein RDWZM_004312 [Blomia tropicalis]